jgi:hypothetical protein
MEIKGRNSARGGYDNTELISWEETNAVTFTCSKGVFSKVGWAIVSNSKLLENGSSVLLLDQIESYTADEDGELTLKYTPYSDNELFVYDSNNILVTSYTRDIKVISNLVAGDSYTVAYLFNYTDDAQVLFVGQRLFSTYVKLTGRMRLKDDIDGLAKTSILEIPHAKIMSDLSIRLGTVPVVSTFQLQGDPVGERKNKYVCKIIYLNNDIDSDI